MMRGGRELLVVLGVLVVLPIEAAAQTTPASKARTTKPTNVQTGSLTAIDASAATVVLKPKTGSPITYRLTEKTHVYKVKAVVEPGAFKAGDEVVVRFRKSSVGPATLYDLADRVSWDWLNHMRHDTSTGIIKELDDENLTILEGTDKAEFSFRVTDKTTWTKAGKPAASGDFKAMDKVFVVPRLLPNGNAMAVAVADGSADASKAGEMKKRTISGVIKTLNLVKKTLTLHSKENNDHDLVLEEGCIIRQAGKDVQLSSLKVGQSVTVHLTRNDTGETVVKQVTILGKKSSPKAGSKPLKKP